MEKSVQQIAQQDKNKINFTISFPKRIILFLCLFLVCYLLAGFAVYILQSLKGESTALLRICAVIQDIVMFIVPALATAVLITRLPARFLCLETRPNWKTVVLSLLVLLVSIPVMDVVVAWNESIRFPESMASIEEWMRHSEEVARASINSLLVSGSFAELAVVILIVGFLAGFSEELFFRGAFQRILSTGGLNAHAAIWLAAFVFSATHLQFYGFFGRLLLGAYFGYTLYWTKCLWVPVILHIFNNTLYIVGNGAHKISEESNILENVGSHSIPLAVASLILTIGGIWLLYKSLKK